MVSISAKTLSLVIAAIKNLRELKGSTSREILQYISSVYNIPSQVARRQTQTALKRGVAYGILKKNGGHYILPTASQAKGQEIAAQEIDLLDLSCRKRRGRRRSRRARSSKRACKCKKRRSRMRRKSRSRGCKRRSRRKRKCKCGGLGKKRDLEPTQRRSPSKKIEDQIPLNSKSETRDTSGIDYDSESTASSVRD